MRDQEYAAILALNHPERYSYFVKRVADWNRVYVLENDGWMLVGDDHGSVCLPVWSHARFAQGCIDYLWPDEGFEIKEVGLERFMEHDLPILADQAKSIAVMMIPSGQGVVVDPIFLLNDLKQECTQYE